MKKLTHEVGKVAYHILIGEFESWEAITSQSVLLNSVFALMLIEKNHELRPWFSCQWTDKLSIDIHSQRGRAAAQLPFKSTVPITKGAHHAP